MARSSRLSVCLAIVMRNSSNIHCASDRLRLVPAHLARRNAARFSQASHPGDDRADAHAKLHRRPALGQSAILNRRNHPLTKIKGIGSCHRMLASIPASISNQNRPDLGIPNRLSLKSSRSSQTSVELRRAPSAADNNLPCQPRRRLQHYRDVPVPKNLPRHFRDAFGDGFHLATSRE